MTERSDIAPETLSIALESEGVEVEYTDGRSVFYHGVPEKREERVVCPPGRDVHVLVSSPDGTEGVMVYVNDRSTHDEILESTGVGRVILERDAETSLFPGVEAKNRGYRIAVTIEPDVVDGRVFVFAEDQTAETAYELVEATEEEAGGDENGATRDGETDASTEADAAVEG
jgi:hypothetical protein